MGIALAWRRGERLPTLDRLRELATAIARAREIERVPQP
jgi:hypothetical protein